MIRFYNLNGVLQRARRFASKTSEADDSDPQKLSELVKKLSDRIHELESKVPPDSVEFEVDVPNLAQKVYLRHDFNCPVRWYVTAWRANGTVGGHSLCEDSESTENVLVIRSNQTGRAVIRIEPSQFTRTKL